MSTYTTEIASDQIPSDNPIHQRLLQAYHLARPYVKGSLMELGCGEGRGVAVLEDLTNDYLALDKIGEVIEKLKDQFPNVTFRQAFFPPFSDIPDHHFDTVVSFQVIEHIEDDTTFLSEIYRVLKPGGKAVLTTPNIKKTLTRNPWHMREYRADELKAKAKESFKKVEVLGITGNEKVMAYYEANKLAVQKITRWDFLNLQYRLPASILRIPYDVLNRINRNQLVKGNNSLVSSIVRSDYVLTEHADDALDLFLVLEK